MAFSSATHDIAADGFYMLALDPGTQSLFVGIRSTFYRLSSIFGQGVLVVIAGILEQRLGDVPRAWSITLLAGSALFALLTLWHIFRLPAPASDSSRNLLSAKDIIRDFGRTFVTFFSKKGIWIAMLFMLLYRLPEAFLVKMMNPFLLDSIEDGGLGLTTQSVGLVYGTIGIAALTVGGILGGIFASRLGLKKSLWVMAACMTLPCITFVYLAVAQPTNLAIIATAISIEQFGYGFGFTAYMLYMMYFSDGEFKTSHYAICTSFMALSMILPGLVAGYIQEAIGYENFFWMVISCSIATFLVTFLAWRITDPAYGKK